MTSRRTNQLTGTGRADDVPSRLTDDAARVQCTGFGMGWGCRQGCCPKVSKGKADDAVCARTLEVPCHGPTDRLASLGTSLALSTGNGSLGHCGSEAARWRTSGPCASHHMRAPVQYLTPYTRSGSGMWYSNKA